MAAEGGTVERLARRSGVRRFPGSRADRSTEIAGARVLGSDHL